MPPRGRTDPGQGSGSPRYPGTFLLALREALERIGWRPRRWNGDMVECGDAGGKVHVIGLENLYRRARRTDRQEWPELIGEFLRTVSLVDQGEGLPTDLAAVADQLLVRLGHPLRAPSPDAKVWSQPVAGTNLCISLVVDYCNRMSYVTEHLVTESGLPGTDWLARGLDNLYARTPPDCFQPIHEESGMLLAGAADAYDSSRALLLDRLLPEARAEGYLVVIPGRDELLVLPITARALAHMHLMKVLADKNFKTVPYPISNEVYWIREGVWRPFPIHVRNAEVAVQPPPEFVEILERLAPPEQKPEAEEPSDP